MASRNSKKSSGLRLLWIPGSRKSHPKGRFSTTNKHVSYTTPQKKSEVWSLGGSIVHRHLLQAEPDIRLLDGPSTSGISSLACATVATTAAAATSTTSSSQCFESHASLEETNENSTLSNNQENQQNSPTTPNSSSSTAPLMSPPLSPLEQNNHLSSHITQTSITNNSTTKTATMPAKSHQTSPIPVIVTATTTDSIMEPNRFSLLAGKDIVTSELDIYSLPSPPTNSNENLNNLSGTTNNTSQNGSVNNSPVKKQQRLHSNDQAGDVNSIESVTEDAASDKIPSSNLDWTDKMVQDRPDRESLVTSKKDKKKKKKKAKNLDQLDGIPVKENATNEPTKDKDEGGDVNSIESITEDTASDKIPSADLDWINVMVHDQQDHENLMKPKKKKTPKDLDQLDGIPLKENAAAKSAEQEDVNSIESITEDTASDKIPSADLDWINVMVQDQQDRETLMKPKKKKTPKDLDQLDGIPLKENAAAKSAEEEDDVFVKCLYYTILCCECTIS